MREIREILAAFHELRASRESGVLATVVRTAGSTYRRAGARLLVQPDDRMIGLLSGGCLEGDLLEHARPVRASGEPRVVRYDLSQEEDVVWGLGLGCAGALDILLERVGPEASGPLDFLSECLRERRRGALATALGGPAGLATRWALHADGHFSGTAVGASDVESAARRAVAQDRDALIEIEAGTVLVEVIRPAPRVLIFGAGADAVPVVRLAAELGWESLVADWRPAQARRERFPQAREVVLCEPDRLGEGLELDDATAVLVMTHHYLRDRALLRLLLPSPARFVGVLGPSRRTEALLADLRGEGFAPSREQLDRLHGPAGLDIGADSPEQIALALIAEIQAVFAGRRGGWLCERKGPLHDPTQ